MGAAGDFQESADDDLPPSAKFVRYQLKDGPLTRSEVIEGTGMSESTIDYALRALEDADVARRDTNPGDARQRVVTLVEECKRHRA